MKIIFLDIDGVLNNSGFFSKLSKPDDTHPIITDFVPEEHLDSENIAQLNSLCEKIDANIIISSTWRHILSLSSIREALKSKGFLYSERIIGQTPNGLEGRDRGLEIKRWIKYSIHPIEGFVILDDNDDMAGLFPHLVKTDPLFGLQEKHVAAALYILNKE